MEREHSMEATIVAPRPRSERFEFRLSADAKRNIAAAATALGMDASDFAREVLTERADEVLAERELKTVVPASYFDDLLAALDAPAQPNEAMRRALDRARQIIEE
jgi:uncharacterized protein (DUF1778 family)